MLLITVFAALLTIVFIAEEVSIHGLRVKEIVRCFYARAVAIIIATLWGLDLIAWLFKSA